MPHHPLDNPVWEALRSDQAGFAMRRGGAARYLPDVTPIVAVENDSAEAASDLAALISPGERLYGVGPTPADSPLLQVEREAPLPQMICAQPIEPGADARVTELGERHRADMLGLTALVYPAYFRERTPELGRYVGIYDGSRLAAMAGERMHVGQWREVSAVCTHPEYTGRGHAQQLMAEICNAILDRGELPFLHVSAQNTRAIALYLRLGFVERFRVGYWTVQLAPGADHARQ